MGAAVSFRPPCLIGRAVLAGVVLAAGVGCTPAPDLDPSGARAHVRALAATIGPRPHGSAAAADARAYVVSQLRALGLTVRIQEADSVDRARGMTARVRNVIASRDGDTPDAIALVAHYDSRPGIAGAVDDALGVATVIEAARALVEPPMRHSLFVLVTDAEEFGLLGAQALVADAEVAGRLKAFLNFEGTGGQGPPLLFETTGGSALTAWTRAFAPVGTSLGTEIYKRMPNDTDFSVLASLGIDGVNIAPIGDSYAYHTDRDMPDRVSDATLAHNVANAIAMVRALDARAFVPGADDMTYFDLAGRRGVAWGRGAAGVVTIASVVLATLAWVLLVIEGRRRTSVTGVISALVSGLVVMAASAAGMLAAGWIVAALRSEVLPWYSAPILFYAFVLSLGALAGWVPARMAARLPERIRPWRSAGGVWLAVLPVWAVAGAMTHGAAPAASYLITVPLTVTALALVLSARASVLVRLASAVSLAVVLMLWLGHAVRLLRFLVPLFGWLPMAPPWWLLPSVVIAAAVMIAPPAVALLAGRRTPIAARRAALILALPVVASGLLTLLAPAYSEERPQRRTLLYLEDVAAGAAWWEVGGGEPAADLGAAPAGGDWTPASGTDDLLATRRLTGFFRPFRYRAPAEAGRLAPPALVVGTTTARPDGQTDLAITIVPRRHVGAEVRLPPGLVPVESSLAGRMTATGWAGTFVAVPTGGLTVRIVLPPSADTPATLDDVRVALTTTALPGAIADARGPDWLPMARSTWSVRAVHIVSVRAPAPDGG